MPSTPQTIVAAVAAGVLAPAALANLPTTLITVTASNALGSGSTTIGLSDFATALDTDFDGLPNFGISGPLGPITIQNTGGDVIAGLTDAEFTIGSSITSPTVPAVQSSSIGGSFALINNVPGAGTTTFTITTSPIPFFTSLNTPGLADGSVGISVTDSAGSPDGAVIDGLGASGGLLELLYNTSGTPQTLASLLQGGFSIAPGAPNSATDSEDFPDTTAARTLINQPVADIALRFEFSVSEGDQLGATFDYSIIVPAPGVAGVLLPAGLLAARRRR